MNKNAITLQMTTCQFEYHFRIAQNLIIMQSMHQWNTYRDYFYLFSIIEF